MDNSRTPSATTPYAPGEAFFHGNAHILDNLNPKFQLRPYQAVALQRFQNEIKQPGALPAHLLFQMATGSGKTLIMAGCMLELFKLGFTNFVFFVNNATIIEKTRENFLNRSASKYLFNSPIIINNRHVPIKAVANFETAREDSINIVFTTIQGLHSKLAQPRENSLTYADFSSRKVVLISDEAHHINAETKKKPAAKAEANTLNTWESTVTSIYRKHPGNVLLEFTATMDFNNTQLKQKYRDKLLINYPLKEFRRDKYSKEIKVLQSHLNPFERTLQAIILSQYRLKMARRHGLDIKPVVLLKSKTIQQSRLFKEYFNAQLQQLNSQNIIQLKRQSKNPVMRRAFSFFDNGHAHFQGLIDELQQHFSTEKSIAVNSKNDSFEKQLLINSLEDQDNPIRAVFAVDKLNEGWDVLNLFDIVKLYESKRNANPKKISKSTLSEAQLIGRGARYCPFKLKEGQDLYRRKFDQQPSHDLKICEELYFHSAQNPPYIAELDSALKHIGIRATAGETPKKEVKSPPKTKFKLVLDNQLNPLIQQKKYTFHLLKNPSEPLTKFTPQDKVEIQHCQLFVEFELPVIRKALDQIPFFRFETLRKHFPQLSSTSEFIRSEQFLKPIVVKIKSQKFPLSKEDKLKTCLFVLKEIAHYQ